jgi:hypothetical protein
VKDTLARLMEDASDLEPDALRVVALIAARLRRARQQYGALDLATDRRNFAHEESEEMLDALAYRTMRALQEADAKEGK